MIGLALALACRPAAVESAPEVAAVPAVGWLKGQTHAHSNRSGDSATPPSDVARWYEAHGFDFVVFTDHNAITTLDWTGSMLVLPGVEITQNLDSCDPPPEGEFCPIHVNALFVDPARPFRPVPEGLGTPGRRAQYAAAIGDAGALGGLAQVNHPNWEYMADGAMLAELAGAGAAFVEIRNGSGTDDEGDARHPSTEAAWDTALTAGARVWGVATDDAHHYFDADAVEASGKPAYRGDRGFVMVRAAKDPASIRAAMERGDFYGSTGVRLARLEVADGTLALAADEDVTFRFVGAGGAVLGEATGRAATFDLPADGYVRAVATAADGRVAFTQPMWRR